VKRVFTNWWVVTGLIVLILVSIFAIGLPLLFAFFKPWWMRLGWSLLFLAIWGLVGWLRARKARKASEAIAAELATPSAADEESAVLGTRMAEALTALRGTSGNKRDYLYSRPWYVIIGPPGAGKTTALLNSGLRFPFADQSFKGVGGTRNLDFWFADEAALVDTAGRYTTQDSDASVDSQGWKSFLGLLKKHRPRHPINGVLVTIGLDELLKSSRSQIDAHAAAVRRRLSELRQTLEVSVPVYLLLTKADLLAGFVEYFDDLDVEGRRAVLGATLPYAQGKLELTSVVSAFDEFVAAQSARQAKRLFEEQDHNRRSLILGFPAQLAAIRSRLSRYVDGAFISGDQENCKLRGFYLTSGVQEGAPLDRILSGMAEVYDVSAGTRQQTGRTYFLNRTLTDVVFGEAGLAQLDPAARARERVRTIGGISAVAASAAVVLGLWGASFFGNRSFQSQLLTSSQQVQTLTRETGVDLVEVRATDPDLEQSLVVLRALRNLPQGYAEREAGGPGLLKRFGLFQSSHSEQAAESYRDGLRRIMLPRLLLRLEQYMQENSANALAVYEPLKVYLMLGGQGPLDKGSVKSWVSSDWAGQLFPGADRASMRGELGQHLKALLEDPNLAAAWPARKTPLDGTTIASARAAVQTLSLADRAYAILRQKAFSSGGDPWSASTVLASGDAQAFADGEKVLDLTVPYFFTRTGFEKSYQLGLAQVQLELQKDMWVLGADANTGGIQAQMGSIRPGVAALYSRDYIAAWDAVVAALKPAAYFSDPAALGAFTKTPSPLKLVLLELRKNTKFDGGTEGAKKMAITAAKAKFGRAATLVPGSGGNLDAGVEIASYFKPIHDYVGDGKAAAPLDEFVTAMKTAGAAVTSARMAGGGMGSDAVQSQMTMSMGSVAASSAGAPPQLQGFVSSATQGGAKAQSGAAKGAISDAYMQSVMPDCQLASKDKYPFFGSSLADASLVDVQRVFGLGGVMESFFQQRVTPLLDTAGPVWRWKADSEVASSLDPASPEEFARAQQVRDLIAAGLAIKIEAQSFGGGVTSVEFSSGGTNYTFDPATTGARPLIWSAQGSLPEASVTFYKAKPAPAATATASGAPAVAVPAKADAPVGKIHAQGPWALFRLMDKARKENAGPQTIIATFGEGDVSVVFRIALPSERNPFGRAGLWSFRCPTTL
jgi:type VI secretion system protein ImpL